MEEKKQDNGKSQQPWVKGMRQKGGPGRPKGSKICQRSSTLRAMRRITRTEADRDKTLFLQRLRKLYEDDFKSFMSQLTQLEKTHAAIVEAKEKEKKGKLESPNAEEEQKMEVVDMDEGANRVQSLIQSILGAMKHE